MNTFNPTFTETNVDGKPRYRDSGGNDYNDVHEALRASVVAFIADVANPDCENDLDDVAVAYRIIDARAEVLRALQALDELNAGDAPPRLHTRLFMTSGGF